MTSSLVRRSSPGPEPTSAGTQSVPTCRSGTTAPSPHAGRPTWRDGAAGYSGDGVIPNTLTASSDLGNVSLQVPAIHPMLAVAPPHVSLHTEEFERYAGSHQGNVAVMDGAVGLAGVAPTSSPMLPFEPRYARNSTHPADRPTCHRCLPDLRRTPVRSLTTRWKPVSAASPCACWSVRGLQRHLGGCPSAIGGAVCVWEVDAFELWRPRLRPGCTNCGDSRDERSASTAHRRGSGQALTAARQRRRLASSSRTRPLAPCCP